MQIACRNCATSYSIDPVSIGESGRMVRCARCHELWFVQAPQFEPAGAGDDAAVELDEQHSDPDIDWHLGGAPLREADYAAGAIDEAHPGEGEFAIPDDAPHVSDAPSMADADFGDGSDPDRGAGPAAQPSDGEEPDYFEVRRRR